MSNTGPRYHYIPLLLILFSLSARSQEQRQSQAQPQRLHIYTYGDTVIFRGQSFFRKSAIPARTAARPTPATNPPRNQTQTPPRTLGNLQLTATATPSTCTEENGSITFHATGGTPPYTYSTDQSAYQSSAFLLVSGPAIDSAWVKDAAGATAYTLVTIGNIYPPVQISGVARTEPSSCDASDGQFTVTATGGTPPYQYSIDGINFQSSPVLTNLAAGAYEVEVMDANGCTNTYFIGIGADGCGEIGSASSDYICSNTGSVTLYAEGGIPFPVQYSDDGLHYQSSNLFTGLGPGVHDFYLIDADGKHYLVAIVIHRFCGLILTVTEMDATCGNNNGSATITPQNGTPPYQYSLDGINYQSSGSFTGLAPGNYTVTVKDVGGDISSRAFGVASGCPSVSAVGTSAVCGNASGSITALGSGGDPPYQYSLDGIHFQTSTTFPDLAAGTYTVTVKDAGNNTATTSVIVTNSCLTITAAPTTTFCSSATGEITVGVTGGTAPYTYSIDGINFQASNTFTGLAAANYTVTVRDAVGNLSSTPVTINNIAGPTLTTQSTPATCAGNDGSVTLAPNGGTSPFEYSLDNINWQPSGAFAGLNTGNYLPYVKDANGCTAALPVTITLTNDLTLDPGGPVTICQGNEATLLASSNGTAFSWSPATALSNPDVLKPTASPATTTTYTCTASWGTCQQQAAVTVTVNPAPIADAGQDTTICYGQSVQLNGSGGTTYIWSPATGLSNPTVPNPIVENPDQNITYQLTVTDLLGCTALQPGTVTVHVTPPTQLFAGDDTSVLINEPIQLNALDINNSGFTSYAWFPATGLNDPDIPNPVATLTTSTTYTITATTPAGCEGTATLTIKVYTTIDLIVPGAFTPNGDGHNDVLKVIPLGIRQLQYFAVFNRWGQRVFYTTDAGKGWDGTISGQPQLAGAYVWMAAGIDFNGSLQERKGSVILIR
jgi:gliding motility-associated-like protein